MAAYESELSSSVYALSWEQVAMLIECYCVENMPHFRRNGQLPLIIVQSICAKLRHCVPQSQKI